MYKAGYMGQGDALAVCEAAQQVRAENKGYDPIRVNGPLRRLIKPL
jgi:hypothetical protein